jgi:pyridoxamine 5'-phosphate oxidase
MNPVSLFAAWYQEWLTTDPPEPSAVALSTSGADGAVSSRMVLLKDFSEDGFVFFTNYNSHKSRQLASDNHAALLFWWHPLGRQVRIEGVTEKVSREISEKYFRSRPRESQTGAWASEQSSVIPDRDYLLERYDHFSDKFSGQDIELPPFWGGFRLVPNMFEFWKEDKHRLHHRIVYRLTGSGWSSHILAP